jgi:TonB family protein
VFLRNAKNLTAIALLAMAFGLAATLPASAQEGRHVKSRVAPQYPELAKRMNVTGVVKLRVTIGANGTVKDAKVIGGHPLLVDPAIEAAKKWKYEPGAEDTTEIVEFHFDNNNN